jgi:hypothetical protein
VTAAKIAASRGGTTLETVIADRGITMPAWDGSPASEAAWTAASESYASNAGGTVYAILGPYMRPDAIWYTEFAALKENLAVNEVIQVDPVTAEETTIFSR